MQAQVQQHLLVLRTLVCLWGILRVLHMQLRVLCTIPVLHIMRFMQILGTVLFMPDLIRDTTPVLRMRQRIRDISRGQVDIRTIICQTQSYSSWVSLKSMPVLLFIMCTSQQARDLRMLERMLGLIWVQGSLNSFWELMLGHRILAVGLHTLRVPHMLVLDLYTLRVPHMLVVELSTMLALHIAVNVRSIIQVLRMRHRIRVTIVDRLMLDRLLVHMLDRERIFSQVHIQASMVYRTPDFIPIRLQDTIAD